ncbi:MAG: 50S ribosomal protein L23 [Thaumarchaeota archaeon]|jgi:large subunit ribosomal protein L23|nr:50S ribosomal protein L23 [Nitrososphaerota archaeon]
MNIDEATKIILKPYITEKTFALVENEQKLCFIVENSTTKPKIVQAVKILYNENVLTVNTARTIYGKKAYVKFESTDKARDLATKIGML